MKKIKVKVSASDNEPDNATSKSTNTAIDLDTDEQVDHQTNINSAYMKISQAECIIDCMLTLGNRLTSEDFKIQLVELADILHDAQVDLLNSDYGETWEVFDATCFTDEDEIDAFEKELEKWTSIQKVKYS